MNRPALSWKIGSALGIPIHIHVSWILIFILVSWTLASDYLPEHLPGLSAVRYWVMGGVATVFLFLSVLLHELGHCYVARRCHIPIERITLFVFGGVAQMRKEAPSPSAEALIAVAGPLVSFGLGGVCLGVALLLELTQQGFSFHGMIVLCILLGTVNLQLGLFNLLPGFPLDGGRILRAGLWAWGLDFHQATKRAAMAGFGFGALFGLVGLLTLAGSLTGWLSASAASGGGWAVCMGMFLCAAALVSRRQAAFRHALMTVPVRELMTRTVMALSPGSTLDDAVDGRFQPYGYGAFPVVDNGHLLGLVTVQDVQAVPTALWSRRRIEEIMRPAVPSLFVGPEAPILQAMAQMAQGGWDRLVVVQDETVIGLVTQSGIVRFLQRYRG
ncbi:MAG: site-2 protease family protein [Nitrospira sp.]|nr:site-2 protease family protein [Nitrospira sp.]MCP9441601.1 site-2 protease family protein [Nitrospira sp.]